MCVCVCVCVLGGEGSSGVEFPYFSQKRGGSIFLIKVEGLVKLESVLKKGVSLFSILTSPLYCFLSI